MKWLTVLFLTLSLTSGSFAAKDMEKSSSAKKAFFKEELKLSDEQLAKIREIRSARKAEVIALKQRLKVVKEDFKAAMKNPNLSNNDLSAKFEEFQKVRDEAQSKRFEMMLAMRSVMTPEQIGKFQAWKEQHRLQKRSTKQ